MQGFDEGGKSGSMVEVSCSGDSTLFEGLHDVDAMRLRILLDGLILSWETVPTELASSTDTKVSECCLHTTGIRTRRRF